MATPFPVSHQTDTRSVTVLHLVAESTRVVFLPRQIGRRSCILPLIVVAVLAACADTSTVEPTHTGKSWKVARIEGSAKVRPNANAAWQPLVGTLLIPGAELKVASESQLQLASAGDIVTAGPGSTFELPAAPAGAEGIIQHNGRMRYEVETRPPVNFRWRPPSSRSP